MLNSFWRMPRVDLGFKASGASTLKKGLLNETEILEVAPGGFGEGAAQLSGMQRAAAVRQPKTASKATPAKLASFRQILALEDV